MSEVSKYAGVLNKIVTALFYFCFQDEKLNEVTDDDEKRLLTFLFAKYDPELHPVLKKTDTVRVKFGISLHQIIEVVSTRLFKKTSTP